MYAVLEFVREISMIFSQRRKRLWKIEHLKNLRGKNQDTFAQLDLGIRESHLFFRLEFFKIFKKIIGYSWKILTAIHIKKLDSFVYCFLFLKTKALEILLGWI